MKLDDPFGRMQRRDEADYEALKAALKRAGVRNADGARRVLAQSQRNALLFCAAVLMTGLLGAGLLPALAPAILALALLLLAVAIKALVKGRGHARRLLAEEFPPEKE
jgi:hypothetical protein